MILWEEMELSEDECLWLFDWVSNRMGNSACLARLLDRPLAVELVDVEFYADTEQLRTDSLESFHEEG